MVQSITQAENVQRAFTKRLPGQLKWPYTTVFYQWHLAITNLDKQFCFFYYNICGFSAERWFGYSIPLKLIILSLKGIHWRLKLWDVRIWSSTFRGQLRSKIFLLFESHYYSFQLTLSISKSFRDVRHQSLLLTFSLYLVPFSRYSTSKFLGFDLDFGPSEVTRGQLFPHSKAHTWFPI